MELKTSSPVFPVAKESVWSPMRGMEDVLCCSSPHNPWIDDSFGLHHSQYLPEKGRHLNHVLPNQIQKARTHSYG